MEIITTLQNLKVPVTVEIMSWLDKNSDGAKFLNELVKEYNDAYHAKKISLIEYEDLVKGILSLRAIQAKLQEEKLAQNLSQALQVFSSLVSLV